MTKSKVLSLVAGALLLVAGIGGYFGFSQHAQAQARKPVANAMRDPSSAQFRNEIYHAQYNRMCGEINAKNGMGAYVGFKRFVSEVPGRFALEGEPATNWPGYDEHKRHMAVMAMQIEHLRKANKLAEAAKEWANVPESLRKPGPPLSDADAYAAVDAQRFKEIWEQFCAFS